ncbi:MAG: RpiB/LacA/LacB family sugar-phosphate isomerase [Bacteroidales bacterium]|nr:RpiB/LacA/LacB family sugar-phosphate isomerase [Bacteroidales bacterium]
MKIVKLGMASDHAGYNLKIWLKEKLKETGYEVRDFGCNSDESCDYPEFAHPLAEALEKREIDMGFSLCGSGNGINMVVNKHSGIRSAICWSDEITRLARSHNDANICAIPSRFVEYEQAWKMVKIFLETDFDGGRHLRRINKIPIS